MKGLRIDFLLRAPVLQSTAASLVCFLLILILLADLPPLEITLLPTIWHVLHIRVLEGPAFAFLLLNCLIVTIIASSKLGSEQRVHGEESQGQLALRLIEKGDGKGDDGARSVLLEGQNFNLDTPEEDGHVLIKEDDVAERNRVPHSFSRTTVPVDGHRKGHDVAESIVEPSLHILDTPLKNNCHDANQKKREKYGVRRSWSLNTSFDVYKTKYRQSKLNHVKEEKKSIKRSRARLACRRNDEVRLQPNKPLRSDLQKKQLITSSHIVPEYSEGTHHESPTQKRKNSLQAQQAEKTAPAGKAAHPTMDEVWAAIVSSKNGGDRMQEEKRSKKPNSKTVKQPLHPAAAVTCTPTQAKLAAAALDPPPVASHTLFAAPAAANANLLKADIASWKGFCSCSGEAC